MKLLQRLELEVPKFIDLQEVDEESILSYQVAKGKSGRLYVKIVLKDNQYSVSFLAKSQEGIFQEDDEVIPKGITSNGIILWSLRPKKKKK